MSNPHPLVLDREKYLKILKTEGISAAISRLHLDKEQWEQATFEGENGYQRGVWDDLQAVRDFSIELWNLSLAETDLSKH